MDSKVMNNDLTGQLTKLSKMHADGVLTDEEFKALKEKLISGISGKQNSGGSTKPAPSNADFQTDQTKITRVSVAEKTSDKGPLIILIAIILFLVGGVIISIINQEKYSQTTTEQTNRLIFQQQEIQRSNKDQQFQNGLRRDFERSSIENQQLQDRMKRDRDDQLRALTAPR